MSGPTAAIVFTLGSLLAGCTGEVESELPPYAIGKLGGDEFLLHPNTTSQIEYSPDGKLIASVGCRFFGAVPTGFQIWDIASGKEIGPGKLHGADAVTMTWSPDGTQYVISRLDEDKEWVVEIWDLATNKRVKRLGTTDRACWSVDWSAEGDRIAAGEPGGPAYVWNASTGKKIMQFEGPAERVALATDGSYLIVGNQLGVFTVTENGSSKRLEIPVTSTNDIEVSARGDQVALGTDRGVVLWSPDTGALTELPSEREEWRVTQVSYDQTGRYLTCLTPFQPVKVWDVDEARFIDAASLLRDPEPQFSADISPDGSTLATAHARLRFVRLDDGERLHDFGTHTTNVRSLEVTPDGRYVISVGAAADVRVWDLETFQLVSQMAVPGKICDAYLFPKRKMLGVRTVERAGLQALRFPEGDVLADDDASREILSEDDYRRNNWHIELADRGETLLFPDCRGDVHLWNLEGTTELGTIPTDVVNLMKGSDDKLMRPALKISPDGRWLARSFWKPATIEILDLETKTVVHVFDKDINSGLNVPCAFSPDGTKLLALGDECVSVFDIESGKPVKTFEAENLVLAIAVSPDGRWVAISDAGRWNFEQHETEDKHVRIVSFETGETFAKLTPGGVNITTMCFTPDSSKFLTGGPDSRIFVWDVHAATRSQ